MVTVCEAVVRRTDRSSGASNTGERDGGGGGGGGGGKAGSAQPPDTGMEVEITIEVEVGRRNRLL